MSNLRWTRERQTRFLIAILIALLISLIVSYKSDPKQKGMVARGDFPAFYAAAETVLYGDVKTLYTPEVQSRLQQERWPSLEGQQLFFAYPPHFAFFLAPLALLPPLVAKGIWTVLMLLCLWGATACLVRLQVVPRHSSQLTFALLLVSFPLTCAVFAGQNTALSVLLLYGTAALLSSSTSRDRKLSGVPLGLLSFKPHFFILFLNSPAF